MASPPPTPPSDMSSDDPAWWRFKTCSTPCELVNIYLPGGFHPVNLGDKFHNGKYKVIRKLGYGSSSTVWLATSEASPKYVALKVMKSKVEASDKELTIIDYIAKLDSPEESGDYLIRPLDRFRHKGPNGEHQCLVYELMAGNGNTILDELRDRKHRNRSIIEKYPKWMAKTILVHALRSLDFLNKHRIVHDSFHPGNLLFAIQDITGVSEEELKQDKLKDGYPMERKDGKVDRWAPTHLYVPKTLDDRAELGPKLRVKLADLGSSWFMDNPPDESDTPIALRAPELILNLPFDSSIDLWSFGCLLFEFLTRLPLFSIPPFGTSEELNDDHLVQMYDIIEPFPDAFMDAWPRAGDWYGPNREFLFPGGDPEERYIYPALEQEFRKRKSDEIDEDEAVAICELLRSILQYDPKKRPSPQELLQHPWFAE